MEETYIVGIYDCQNNLTQGIEVEATSQTEAEAIGWEEFLDQFRNSYYASANKKGE